MKINDVYYHPEERFIWLIPDKNGWDYNYKQLHNDIISGFTDTSDFQKSLIFVTSTSAPSYAELCKSYPELLI